MTQTSRERGFTLIELLIVLVIIGILATLAIPRYLAFRSRAMQAEVKANLGAFHHAETAYLAEKNSFTDDLRELAWRPTGQPRYLYGFTSDALPASSGANDTSELAAIEPNSGYGTVNMVSSPGVPLLEADLPTPSAASLSTFTFGAAANLDADSTLDQWSVTERNQILANVNDAD